MRELDTADIIKRIKGAGDYFYTFVDRPGMAAGLIYLEPGRADTQEPHDSDELYYIVSGDGLLKIGKRHCIVAPGKIFFVGAGVPHHFFGNTRTIVAVYLFGGPGS